MTIAIGQPTPMAIVRQIIRRGISEFDGGRRRIFARYADRRRMRAQGSELLRGWRLRQSGHACIPARGGAGRNRSLGMRGRDTLRRIAGGGPVVAVSAVARRRRNVDSRGQSGSESVQGSDQWRNAACGAADQTRRRYPARGPCDAYGNVQHLGGPGWIDLFMYRAADRTIVQVEKIVANEDVRAEPGKPRSRPPTR